MVKEKDRSPLDSENLLMKYIGDAFKRAVGDTISKAVEDGVARAMANFQPRPVESKAPKYYSRKDVADLLHISYPTLHGLMNKNAIKFIKVGKKTLFPQAELDAMIASGELRKYRRTC